MLVVIPSRTRRIQSSSPLIARTSIPPTFDVVLSIGATLLISITFQTNHIIVPIAIEVPWGNAIGPLTLVANNDFPRESREKIPRFNGDGTISVEQHLNAFHKACGVVNPQHEDVAIGMFVDTIVDNVVDWFQDLPVGCIKDWNHMKQRFKECYKNIEDAQVLLLQLAQIKKEPSVSMRYFNVNF